MIISQHSFCPLGFLDKSYYDDNMSLSVLDSMFCTSLSPCFGDSFISFLSVPSSYFNFRAWLPLMKRNANYFNKISLDSVFLYSVNCSVMSKFGYVLFLNF